MFGVDLLLPLLLLTFCSAEGNTTRDALRTLPCPAPEDIFPCACTVDEKLNMDMDCSLVYDEEQLAQVFAADLPFTNFRKLTIEGSPNLRVLRKGDLGPTSFRVVFIENGVLQEVQDGAFSQSYSTAVYINLRNNNVSKFPFHELPLFRSIATLLLGDNAIQPFPLLVSNTLKSIELTRNAFTELPINAFRAVLNISTVLFAQDNLQQISPGTFVDFENLYLIDASYNNLSQIPKGTFTLGRTRPGDLRLEFNNISKITVGSITGLQDGTLRLHHNSLSEFSEDVFRTILERDAHITIYENPLICGCDIAWLITNPNLMNQIISDPPASCFDGELLEDLDPSVYEDMCSEALRSL